MTRRSTYRARRVLPAAFVACAVLAGCGMAFAAGPAFAGAGWELTARSEPTNFSPAPPTSPRVSGTIAVDVFNIGSSAAGCTAQQYAREQNEEHREVFLCPKEISQLDENTITITDRLPAGLRATNAGELIGAGTGGVEPTIGHAFWSCTGNATGAPPDIAGATVVTCTNKITESSAGERDLSAFPGGGGAPTQVDSLQGAANPQPQLGIAVDVQPGAGEGTKAGAEANHVTIAGGGAPTAASTADPVTINPVVEPAAEPRFGFTDWDGWFSNADGTLDTQAGSHPYEAVFSFNLATALTNEEGVTKGQVAGSEIKTAEVQLPPGFVGNPTAIPQCSRLQFDAERCSQDSMIGTTTVYFANSPPVGLSVFNLVPPPGVPAEFAFNLQGLNTYLDASVRSGSDYGITEHVSTIAHKEITQAITTLWGEPGDPSHNRWRSGVTGGCSQEELEVAGKTCTTSITHFEAPLLTLPTACTGEAQPFVIHAVSWSGETSESTFYSHTTNGPDGPTEGPKGPNAAPFTGCENLAFGPSISTSPDTSSSDTPAGLTVDVKPPLGGLEEAAGLSSSDIQDTTVKLPAGLVINPGQAAGLQACQFADAHVGDGDDGPAECPNASKVGTVTAKTPLLEGAEEKELTGAVYVLQSNPPHLQLLAAFSADGVNVKLVLDTELCQNVGEVLAGQTCEAPGQIVTKVANIPEFPVSDFKLSFSGGAQAALDTPAQCGTYTATSDFTPWSSPFIGDAFPTGAFGITAGPGGGACPSNPMPFAPSLTAGATTDQAGGFTDFSLLLQRGDGQQRIEKLSFKAPAGLSGIISSVPLCDEADANAGSCPAASHIGHTVVASGPGPYPLVLPQPGEPELPIYLTGPYQGAPFGLSIVTPVLAGPFNLGTIVTRAKIEVDPHTAQITVTTTPLPQIVAGVPTDLRSIDAVIDRPGFMFNPTNCSPQSFSGTATSAGGAATAPISTSFQVGSCASLKFAPKFAVSTPGRTSKAQGAGLSVKLTYPKAAQGTQANIKSVKVDLPKQLPSQLKTLQKACLAATFESNPESCPKHSVVGEATVTTPLLPVPLTGKAYFVSHGGEAFPSLTMVLKGDNVTIDLVGSTFIHGGVTSSTFKAVPDVPFSTFTLTLGQGEYAALGANLPTSAHHSFCGQKLAMPTAFVAQDGAEIHESTKISVSGCKKAHKVKKKKATAKKKAKR